MTEAQLHKVQYPAQVDVDGVVLWLEDFPRLVELVFEVVLLFRDACVGYSNVHVLSLLIRSSKIGPGRRVTLDKGRPFWSSIGWRREVKNIRVSPFGGKNLHSCKADA